jgi:hypothetical protein|tara:strand:+ start:10171 stop:10569 length:399 start_codon:yes stop_codon:yes gene_type:complete
MAVTTDNIRDLLGRPKGLLTITISEYINIRTNFVDKVARDDKYLNDGTNAVSTALKEDAIKMLVAVDCLSILIDTLPGQMGVMDSDDGRFQDRRYQYQLDMFRKRAKEALDLVSDSGSSAFAVKSTSSRISG